MKAERTPSSGNVFKVPGRPLVALSMASVGIFFMRQVALFTYVRPFLETVTRVDVSTLSLILLLIGIAGFIRTSLIGVFLKSGIYRTLILIPVLISVIALTLITFGRGVAVTAMLLGIWGLIAMAAPVGWWACLARSLPQSAEAGGGLMVAVIRLAITLGATVGGVLFDVSGYQNAFSASALLLLVAAFLTVLTSREGRAAA
jgi:predicted MFS family arabinose efflux permease